MSMLKYMFKNNKKLLLKQVQVIEMNETYKHSTLQDANKTLNAVLEVISEGVWDWNVVTGYVHRSPSWYRMLEYKVDFFEKNVFSWENIIHPKDYERVMEHFEVYINGTLEKYEI
jgi:PAS domain-containing protein